MRNKVLAFVNDKLGGIKMKKEVKVLNHIYFRAEHLGVTEQEMEGMSGEELKDKAYSIISAGLKAVVKADEVPFQIHEAEIQ